jgi:hypothetical protein
MIACIHRLTCLCTLRGSAISLILMLSFVQMAQAAQNSHDERMISIMLNYRNQCSWP